MEIKLNNEDCIEINGTNNFHISKIEVVYGDDDYMCKKLYSHKTTGEVVQITPCTSMPTRYRQRHEPAAKVFFHEEGSDVAPRSFVLEIAHHKGCIYLHTSEIATPQ